MNFENTLLVGAGGAVGALARYSVGEIIQRERFPLSILVVNLLGSFIAGLLLFVSPRDSILLFVSVGFCGAFTTFSSFSFQTVYLWSNDNKQGAIIHAGSNLILCLIALALAWLIVGVLV
ncbi:fluoride efflux transporter CrcB [Salinarchaeum sp. IM2453]|uniref:fluoride efflux transporter CrcB n=1 Tax=Salinarchaeum sp. IM2453 TaxID=2862870 RepID=UPI001C83AF7E|nr:fluoride efflux transporter CrcB [Salinarchaeum sp. IM2453]QZA89662.1 fluoride efflux transporter CrcB [Salinarchaeum sp. IM2453]